MPHSKEQQSKLEKAFQEALNLENDIHQTNVMQFDAGATEILPRLMKESLSKNIENHEGVEFNHYKIIKQIGSGGMGNVYLANRNDGQFDKIVAIKVLTKGFSNQNIKRRFLREKQILAQLRHPNIVPLLDAGTTEDGIPWFVLEFIDGQTINKIVTSHELTSRKIVSIMIKTCDAIHYAHTLGIFHRDIKPDNIIIEENDGEFNPFILDFGIAHQNDSQKLTDQGHLIGTPGYMSPEQIKGEQSIDNRTDIFSLGVVLYQLFSGTKPFNAPSTVDIHQKIIHDNPTKLCHLIPSFPIDLQIIVETCLNKKPQNRYQSALNLKQDLENWMNGYPIQAQKESFGKVFWRMLKRHKKVAIFTSTIFILGILSIVKYTFDLNQEKRIAIQANAESDDLFNFLLKDLHTELAEIGRVDLLQSVAEKNLQHLNKYNFNLSNAEKIKYVESYRNIASVLEMQQDTSPSIKAYTKANDILLALDNNRNSLQQKTNLLALNYSDLASLHAKLGKLDLANDEHTKALIYAQQLIEIEADNATETQWNVIHPLSWNLMEQSNYKQAKVYLDQALSITNQQLANGKKNKLWQTKNFKSLVAMGWYYIDLREINKSISYYQKAMKVAEQMLENSPNSVLLINNLQKTNNQIAYAYVLNKDNTNAILSAQRAVKFGELLYIRAPDNNVYYRALSYSYTMLGNAFKEQNKFDLAEKNFKASLDISKVIARSSPENASLQNDLAVDMLNFADLLEKKGDKIRSRQFRQESEITMQKIASIPHASIYYIDTYVYVLLILGKAEKAQPYLQRMKNTEGWPHESYQNYTKEFNLETTDKYDE